MSNYSFRAHAASDHKKWIVVSIAILLIIAVIVTGVLTDWFVNWNKYCLFGHDYDDNGVCTRCGAEKLDEVEIAPSADSGGGIITYASDSNFINVEGRRILREEYDAYGIMPIAESAQQLTATVLPANSSNSKLDWSVAWKNPSSSWASGKTVTQYVTVTPTTDGAVTANVQCLKAFSEQIIVTARSRQDTGIFGTATVEYVKRITSVNLSLTPTSATFGATYTVNATPVYGNGTLTGTFTQTGYTVDLSESIKSAIVSVKETSICGYSTSGGTPMGVNGSFTFTGLKINSNIGQKSFSFQGSNISDFGDIEVSEGAGNRPALQFPDKAQAHSYANQAIANSVNNKFLEAVKAESGNHLTFTLSYTYSYDSVVNDSNSATFGLKFDASSLVVHVTSISLNKNIIF